MVTTLPTILSYGMGVESSAILVRWILSPETRPCPLEDLIVKFFQPNGYTLSGEVSWEGDQSGDTGVIHLDGNRIESVSDTITNAGPSWRPQLPEPKVLELVRAGRLVLTHWDRGDLAAQVRRLASALEGFAGVPDEG